LVLVHAVDVDPSTAPVAPQQTALARKSLTHLIMLFGVLTTESRGLPHRLTIGA
jgi:hypothetical protein